MRWDPPPDRPRERVGLNTVRSIVQEQLETAKRLARQALLPRRDVEPIDQASQTNMLMLGPDGKVVINPEWRLRSQPAVKPPAGVSEQAYAEARTNADRAATLLAKYGRAAVPLGIGDPIPATEGALSDARAVLNLYEPTFTAIAQRREAEERRIAEQRRELEYREMQREMERLRIEARSREIP